MNPKHLELYGAVPASGVGDGGASRRMKALRRAQVGQGLRSLFYTKLKSYGRPTKLKAQENH